MRPRISMKGSVRPSVRVSVRPSVRPCVRPSVRTLTLRKNRRKRQFQPARRIVLPARACLFELCLGFTDNKEQV